MKIKSILLLISFGMLALPLNALDRVSTYSHMRGDIVQLMTDGIDADLAKCKVKKQLLHIDKHLLVSDLQYWSDGCFAVVTAYDSTTNQVELYYENVYDPKADMLPSHMLNVHGKKVNKADSPQLNVTVEKFGNYTMLVYRDAKGLPVYSFYSLTQEQLEEYYYNIFIYYMIAGNYMMKDGENAIFGVGRDFYEGKRYNHDPGIFSYYVYPDNSSIDILYGNGRVSHGDPRSPKYGKMPGGGGAGAIMGPMKWNIKISKQGLDVKIVEDQPFVDHSPRLDSKAINVLTKVQCPWQGVDGKWAFASVMPLTHQLLKLFPKDVLELMLAEISARHGASFKQADIQKYFNQQPWYKKSKKPTYLTDIERFNADLIKQVMKTL